MEERNKIKPIDILNILKSKNIFNHSIIYEKVYERLKYDLLPKNVSANSIKFKININNSFQSNGFSWNCFSGEQGEKYLSFILGLICSEFLKEGWHNVSYEINKLDVEEEDKSIDIIFRFYTTNLFQK